MNYGQFCPIAKATELLGEKWTILIIRELLNGASHFNELRRGLGSISTAVLTDRLKSLTENELIVRRQIKGGRGYEYFPTKACEELKPVLIGLGEWGMRWTKDHLVEEDFDAELLMLYLERSIAREMLPGPETVLRFEFTDSQKFPLWWLIVSDKGVDVCTKDPGRDIDVYLNSTVRVMTEIWIGHRSYRDGVKSGDLTIVGPSLLTKTMHKWLRRVDFIAP